MKTKEIGQAINLLKPKFLPIKFILLNEPKTVFCHSKLDDKSLIRSQKCNKTYKLSLIS